MPLFLAFTLLFAVYLHYQIRKNDKARPEKDDLIKIETKANFTRKADISNLNYLKIPFERLPFGKVSTDELVPDDRKREIISCEKMILSLKDAKILNLTGITNTELKLSYGAANLPFLMLYDENFSKLSRALNKWGKLLYESKEASAAKQVLELAVDFGCDIEEIYLILAKIYKEENNPSSLSSLKSKLDFFDDRRRESLLRKLEKF